jgi:hypothetical protein
MEDESVHLSLADWQLFIPEDLEEYLVYKVEKNHPVLYHSTSAEEMYATAKDVLKERHDQLKKEDGK